ncbi:MAG TPA: ArsC family transcriptional regulator [Planctomycetes bacterium]|nr:ArsC family transcriptional regulator [Planctomycetota bacterium]
MLTVYAYSGCSTCRQALAHLTKRGVTFREIPIREQPPTVAELRRLLAAYQGDLRRLFNTSGQEYRAQGMAQRLPGLATEEALRLLAANGNLCKRPMVVGPGVALAGFKPAEWTTAGL